MKEGAVGRPSLLLLGCWKFTDDGNSQITGAMCTSIFVADLWSKQASSLFFRDNEAGETSAGNSQAG
jgi:hypothetical protein